MIDAFKGHPDQHFGPLTYAQHGDDLMLANLFKLMGISEPSYLDLGAHHPFIISNTALLYARGSRGINVEANPNLINNFRNLRPNDINILAGVGVIPGLSSFYMYSDTSGRNTMSEKESQSVPGMTIKKSIQIEVMTITQIVEAYCHGIYPDLLSTDIEGLDYDVLCSADFSVSKPKVIITEVRRAEGLPIKNLLRARGYFTYCRMGENLIFVANPYEPLVY